MSPEKHQSKSEKAINADNIELGLKEYYIAEKLQPGTPVEIPRLKNRNELLANAYNEKENVFQGLRGEMRVGNEILGIVDVFAKVDNGVMEGTAITRSVPGGRAELVCFVKPDELTELGRRHNDGLDNAVSSNHLALGFGDNGNLNIMDVGSTNGTKLYRHKIYRSDGSDIKNPTTEINNWSLKSAEVKQIMYGSLE